MKRQISFLLHLLIATSMLTVMPGLASGFTLDIFGNANMDDTINSEDIVYVQGVINGTNKATELADANYDGKMDEKDIAQIELIIRGEEKNLTVMQYIKPYTANSATREPVTVHVPIKRIVDLGGTYGPEMLCVLDDADKIVGVADVAKTRGEFRDLITKAPIVGSTNEWDLEKILTLKPDVVIAYAIYDYSNERKILNESGITLVQMNFYIPETYNGEVRKLGWLLGKKERAEELINFEEEYLNLINDRIKGLKDEQKPRVYAESYKDLQYGGASTSINMAVDLCGGIDIFKDLNSSGTIDSENVIANNPQVILKQTSSSFIPLCGYDATNSTRMEMAAKVESIMNRTGWDHIDAVKNKRVYIITSDAASIHPSIFYSYVAKWLHPELFKDMNPVAIHKEWLQKFLGVDFKGVYACPLLEEC